MNGPSIRGGLAVLLGALLGACSSTGSGRTYQTGYDAGYLAASADAAKRLYWARRALDRRRAGEDGGAPAGRMRYYEIEEPAGAAPDGRRLAAGTVAVPVYVPDQAPGAGGAAP